MSLDPTDAMIKRFEIRTRRHISLVASNLLHMEGYLGLEAFELEERARVHDLSKYSDRERHGYIWLTWIYDHQGRPFEVPRGVADLVESCLRTHRERNAHHPEAHRSLDAMSLLDLVEMVCDWTAIAQENGGDRSARGWAERNMSRWSFSRSTRGFILLTIDELDRRNRHAPQVAVTGRRVVTTKRATSPTDAATRPVQSSMKPRRHAAPTLMRRVSE